MRRSGLSEPKRSMASAQLMRGNGFSSTSALQHVGEQAAHHGFHHGHDGFLVHERGFDIELGELGLAVGAQILVAKTAHDLVVAIHARHHQQLLEQLRRLRQGEKRTRMGAARHQVIARALGRGLGQHRRFDVEKLVGLQPAAQVVGNARAAACGTAFPACANRCSGSFRRLSSCTSSSSSWNGGVSDAFRMSSERASNSTSPVAISGFSVPSGRTAANPRRG